jgi:hypothetical protein
MYRETREKSPLEIKFPETIGQGYYSKTESSGLLLFTCSATMCTEQGGGLDPRTAIEGSFSAWGGLGKPDRGLGRGVANF